MHLAWQIQPSHQRSLLRRTNVDGTRHVVDACLRAGVPKLVYASSVGTYAPGPKDRMVDESWSATGVRGSMYSEDKAAVEGLLDDVAQRHHELTVVRLRPGLIFQAGAAGPNPSSAGNRATTRSPHFRNSSTAWRSVKVRPARSCGPARGFPSGSAPS